MAAQPAPAREAPGHHVSGQHVSDPVSGHHIYCIRGLGGIFSLGMDELCGQLSRMGMNTSVHTHLVWRALAEEAAADYKAGRVRNIILVGHSWGGSAVADIAARLGEAGVPVRLAVELDSIWGTTASGQVDQFVNYYVASGAGKPVARGAHFKGTLQNIDVSNDPNMGHLTIDKDPGLQAKIIALVQRAVARSPAAKPAAASTRAHSGGAS